jgi:hypothetical protein
VDRKPIKNFPVQSHNYQSNVVTVRDGKMRNGTPSFRFGTRFAGAIGVIGIFFHDQWPDTQYKQSNVNVLLISICLSALVLISQLRTAHSDPNKKKI